MRTITLVIAALVAAPVLASCGGSLEIVPGSATPAASAGAPAGPGASSASGGTTLDPLGPRPDIAAAAPFQPPSPVTFEGPNGLTVWLVERHTLPLVAVNLVVPYGSSSDPKTESGLASVTANMLDEGAGDRGPLDLARAVDLLGAALATGTTADMSFTSLSVLKKNLAPAMSILADVVTRPRLDTAEWRRVRELWKNELRARRSDPQAVFQVASTAALFGLDEPYGRPVDGTLASAERVSLEDVKRFHRAAWRPDRATLVVVGDLTPEETRTLLDKALGGWKAPAEAPPPIVEPAAPKGPWPKLVIVDRPDAPQSVIALVRPGLSAKDPDQAAISRVNAALGGSFTSRLNQDLREEHGWTYGARSRVSRTRGVGQVVCSAAVFTDKTGDALKAMIEDVRVFATKGLTTEEEEKTRMLARADLVSDYESASRTAARLGLNAAIGLPADHEGKAATRRDTTRKEDLDRLAARYFDVQGSILVIVGPRARITPQIAALGLPAPELRDAEGRVVTK